MLPVIPIVSILFPELEVACIKLGPTEAEIDTFSSKSSQARLINNEIFSVFTLSTFSFLTLRSPFHFSPNNFLDKDPSRT